MTHFLLVFQPMTNKYLPMGLLYSGNDNALPLQFKRSGDTFHLRSKQTVGL